MKKAEVPGWAYVLGLIIGLAVIIFGAWFILKGTGAFRTILLGL